MGEDAKTATEAAAEVTDRTKARVTDRAIDVARLLLAHFTPGGSGELVIPPDQVARAPHIYIEMVVTAEGARLRWWSALESNFRPWRGPLPGTESPEKH